MRIIKIVRKVAKNHCFARNQRYILMCSSKAVCNILSPALRFYLADLVYTWHHYAFLKAYFLVLGHLDAPRATIRQQLPSTVNMAQKICQSEQCIFSDASRL